MTDKQYKDGEFVESFVENQQDPLRPEVDAAFLRSLQSLKDDPLKPEVVEYLEAKCIALMINKAEDGKDHCRFPVPELALGFPINQQKAANSLCQHLQNRPGIRTVIEIDKNRNYFINISWADHK